MGEKLPSGAGSGVVWLSMETYEKLRLAAEHVVVPDPKAFDVFTRAGQLYFRPKRFVPDSQNPKGGTGGGRFVPSIGGDNSDKLLVSQGVVIYLEMEEEKSYAGEAEKKKKGVVAKAISPTIDGTKLWADPPPALSLAGKSDGSLWLICQNTRCSAPSLMPGDDPERIELTGRGDKPEVEKGEIAVPIADFDLETGDGGSKTITNLRTYLQSDHEQWYGCEGDFNSSNDGGLLSSASSDFDPTPSNSSDDDSDPTPDGCEVGWKVSWVNKVTCFPVDPVNHAHGKCTPAPFVFEIKIQIDDFDFYEDCLNWWAEITCHGGTALSPICEALGGKVSGDAHRFPLSCSGRTVTLRWRFPVAPACNVLVLTGKLRSNPDEDSDGSPCCGTDIVLKTKVSGYLPKPCGKCICSGDDIIEQT